MAHLIICPSCGAPLPKQAAQAAFAVCVYCRSTANIEARIVTERVVGAPDPGAEDVDFNTQRFHARQQFEAALRAEGERGAISYARLRELCARHLDIYGVTDAVARVGYTRAPSTTSASSTCPR